MLEKYNEERDIAKAIKLSLDEKYMPQWHCIVVWYFSSKVAYEDECYLNAFVNSSLIAVMAMRTCASDTNPV
ncbi:Dynein light chain 1, cytoplasmic [Trichinella sp. T6]|nr:Dynein light chain 1, cytoplasmic [Trichinella sp. T6]